MATNKELAEIDPFGGANLEAIPTPESVIAKNIEIDSYRKSVFSINDFPAYIPEDQNPNILIKGRWLERGGSAWWISTAGTGKSIASVQLAYKWGAGLDFAGLQPRAPLRSWIIQSEDSPSRVTIDREDITAELSEIFPDVNWKAIGENQVKFVKISGKVGAAFITELDRLLSMARRFDEMPDYVIINPFLAVVGGPVSDGGYVTPFLRGGEISGQHTDGLQALLEKHNVATLIFHHTAKPPTDKEIEAWVKSPFPEYQGAGSSDITNWGRSFVTMMKNLKHPHFVCMVAGKNGGEIGWEEIAGNHRRYMAWSDEVSITGGRRHAWRDLTEIEYDQIVRPLIEDSNDRTNDAIGRIVAGLKEKALNIHSIEEEYSDIPRRTLRQAIADIKANPMRYHLTKKQVLVGRNWMTFIGLVGGIDKTVTMLRQQYEVDQRRQKNG